MPQNAMFSYDLNINGLSLKVVILKNYQGLPLTVISHLKNRLIRYVEKLAKNCMRYPEFLNIYHNTKNGFYSKLL